MWLTSFNFTADNRVNNLVSSEFMVRLYSLIKRDYTKPRHMTATNTSIPTNKTTMISQEEDTIDASTRDLPVQEDITTDSLPAPTPQEQDNKFPLTRSILLKFMHQDLESFPIIGPEDTPYEAHCREDKNLIPE